MNPDDLEGLREGVDPATERRRHPRLATCFVGRVRGVEAAGKEFECEAELRDISEGGFYARITEAVRAGAKLTAEFSFVARPGAEVFRVTGRVLRVQHLIDRRYGVAVEFTNT